MANLEGDIEKYRKGELTSAEMHALEKKALHDPFLAEAMEGLESISPEDVSLDINEINQKILSPRKRATWFTPLRIAAGIILLTGCVFLLYNVNKPEEQLAQTEEPKPNDAAPVEDSLAKKNQQELLSLNQPKDEFKTELKPEQKKSTGPSEIPTTKGAGESKPTAGVSSSSSQTTAAITDEEAKVKSEQAPAAELSEITLADAKEDRGKIAAEPAQQELKKAAAEKEFVSSARARKSVTADDVNSQRTVTGQVTSLEDGVPLPGVNVTIKGTASGTVTDAQGNYSIPLESDKQQLVFSFIGLQTSEVSPNDKSTLNVKLAEDVSQLSEVVVTGQGFKPDRDENVSPVIKLAEPYGGRKAYDKYLEGNLRYPVQALDNQVKGKVTITFTVGTDGTLRDFSVIKSLGYGCDDEVIRLVKDGPKWSPSTEDNVAIESGVRVKMKFDPEKIKK